MALKEKLAEEASLFTRHGRIFSLMILDLDHCKRVNDKYGHPIGDRCSSEVLSAVSEKLRHEGFGARFGGEEFVVVMPETDLEGGRTLLARADQALYKAKGSGRNCCELI